MIPGSRWGRLKVSGFMVGDSLKMSCFELSIFFCLKREGSSKI